MDRGKLLFEVWEYAEDAQHLSSLEYAAPSRRGLPPLMPPGARLRAHLWASSHFEAMTLYYGLKGWGECTTDEPLDHEPFPDEWIEGQRKAGIGPPPEP